MSEETRCRICGRRLIVPESVKREIGPVCWGRLKRSEITEGRRGSILGGETVWLTLTELLRRLPGTPFKHLMFTWKRGEIKEETSSMGLEMGLSTIPKKEERK